MAGWSRIAERGGSALHRYAIGLGSNRRHPRHGPPERVIAAALATLAGHGALEARSPTIRSAPLGPSRRRYANAAAILATALDPHALLALLQRIERDYGRRRGRRWGPRVLDLDILLWSGGMIATRRLALPHAALAQRRFVLDPLAAIAPTWRVPRTGRTVRQLAALRAPMVSRRGRPSFQR